MSTIHNNFKYDPHTIAAVLKLVHDFPAPSTDIPSEGIAEILRTGIEPALRQNIEDAREYVLELIAELALEEAEEGTIGFPTPPEAFIDDLEDHLDSEPVRASTKRTKTQSANIGRVGTIVFTLFVYPKDKENIMSSFLSKGEPKGMFEYYIIALVALLVIGLVLGFYDSHEREKDWHVFEVTNHCRVTNHFEPTTVTAGSRLILVPGRTGYACDNGFYEERNDDGQSTH